MRHAAGLVVLLSLSAVPTPAEVVVRVRGDRVDVSATGAPLAEVLDGLAEHTGMRVVYEGPVPHQLVTVSLRELSPAEAVVQLFEGLGLNYALLGESTGTRVQTLLVAGSVGEAEPMVEPTRRGFPAAGPQPDVEPPEGVPEGIQDIIDGLAGGVASDGEGNDESSEGVPEGVRSVLAGLREDANRGETPEATGASQERQGPTEGPASVSPFDHLPGGFADYQVSPFTPQPSREAPGSDPGPGDGN